MFSKKSLTALVIVATALLAAVPLGAAPLTMSNVFDFTVQAPDALAFATRTDASLDLVRATHGSRRFQDRVEAGDREGLWMTFTGGETARVVVRGDGDTDVDVFVYDQFGNLIDSDEDYTDYCVVEFTPLWTGQFYIEIVNFGSVYNRYSFYAV